MPTGCELRLDAATGISQGRREHQEDAIAADFAIGGDIGLAVIADGMGGHAAGDVASRIAVTEVFGALKIRAGDPDGFVRDAPAVLRAAADGANACLADHVRRHADTRGMGTTLVALAVAGDRLHWLSIGDSPLFLFRDGKLRRINATHSLATQIDDMARLGLIGAEEARRHPDRNCLTSALAGTPIGDIDCPEAPLALADGDILIAATDGLTFIETDRLRAILARNRRRTSQTIARALLHELERIADPEQDNACFAVIRVLRAGDPAGPGRRPPARTARAGATDGQPGRSRRASPVPMLARLLFGPRRRTP